MSQYRSSLIDNVLLLRMRRLSAIELTVLEVLAQYAYCPYLIVR